MHLVVVESPNKVKKIQSLLGSGYEIVATLGHFRDLPRKELGIDLETMQPQYVAIEGKTNIEQRLRAKAKNADAVLLATDPDREGEGIAWHVSQIPGLKGKAIKRVRFHEITKPALKAAIANAGALDQHLVDAQQARRVLDRLCGYQISPLLWPFGRTLSAGRVQSATLHLIVARAAERRAFKVETFWHALAHYEGGSQAVLVVKNESGKLQPLRFADEAAASRAAQKLQNVEHQVEAVIKRDKQVKPRPPFTTSTLQQAASAVLSMRPEETMAAAQRLFEAGLITYHRTDSVQLSDEAVQMARAAIAELAPEALPPTAPVYKSRAGSQEAHEAIRPTALDKDLSELDDADKQLWKLIVARFLASQCSPAKVQHVEARIRAGDQQLVAKASKVVELGHKHFLGFDETRDGDEEDEQSTPFDFHEGQTLVLEQTSTQKGQTKPPPAYTEATLVREMERVGIGRPSTYAATVKLLRSRKYITVEKRLVVPTELGELVDELLSKGFADLLEPEFTARMEEYLDDVARGGQRWRPLCKSYQEGLLAQIERARPCFEEIGMERNITPQRAEPKPTGKECPQCKSELLLRQGQNGAFLACSRFPECRYTLDAGDADEKPQVPLKCPRCENTMYQRSSRWGRFWFCPGCETKVDIKGLTAAYGATCPECGSIMVVRESIKGKFLACGRYPDCRHTISLCKRRVNDKAVRSKEVHHGAG